MAKTFTNDEKREIEEKAKYILTAMDDIGKNGDAYCTDEQLFRASKAVRPSLTGQRYRTDKALLLQAGFLHQEGYHLYVKRTWDYEVAAAKRLADILKDSALPVMEIPRELRAGDILLSEQQREAIELAPNSRLNVLLGGAGCGRPDRQGCAQPHRAHRDRGTHGPRRAWEEPGCKLSGRRFVELHRTGRRR